MLTVLFLGADLSFLNCAVHVNGFLKIISVVSMETWVADDFYGGEEFLNFTSCKILSVVASEKHDLKNLSYCPRTAYNTSAVYTVGIVSNNSYALHHMWV